MTWHTGMRTDGLEMVRSDRGPEREGRRGLAEQIAIPVLLAHFAEQGLGPDRPGAVIRARDLADAGVVDLVVELFESVGRVEIQTDAGINPASVYLVERDETDSVVVWLSTVLPYASVAVFGQNGRYEGMLAPGPSENRWPELRILLAAMGVCLLGEDACRRLSPYKSDEPGVMTNYFGLLFEFDVPPPWEEIEIPGRGEVGTDGYS